MTKEGYVKAVIKKLECSKAKKKEIQNELLSDMNSALQNGDSIEDVIEKIGTVNDTAKEFNENFSAEERKKASKGKKLKVALIICGIVILLVGMMIAALPKSYPIEWSKNFDEASIDARVEETILLMDQDDFETLLSQNADPQLTNSVSVSALENAKKMVSDEWGANQGIGTIYCVEVSQLWKHYATAQVNVTYENVAVTYTLSFNENMELAGIYMK